MVMQNPIFEPPPPSSHRNQADRFLFDVGKRRRVVFVTNRVLHNYTSNPVMRVLSSSPAVGR